MKKIFTLLFSGLILVNSYGQKKVAYVVSATFPGGTSLDNDVLYNTLSADANFTVDTVNCAYGSYQSTKVQNADLVILSEAPGSTTAGLGEYRGIDKPFLMMKTYGYKNDAKSFAWSTAGYGDATGKTYVEVPLGSQNHALFAGVTFVNNDSVQMFYHTTAMSSSKDKALNYMNISNFTYTGGTITSLGTIKSIADASCILEIDPNTVMTNASKNLGTGTTTVLQKFIQLGYHYQAYNIPNNITIDGVRIFMNACYYLTGGTRPAEVKVTGITLTSEGGATTMDVTDSIQLSAAIEPAGAFYKLIGWSVDNSNIAYIDSLGKVKGLAAGTVIAKATALDGSNVSQEFTITINSTKQDQTITFADIPAKTFGDANFDPGAIASSGLAVTYASSNTAVATVSGSTVTIVGAGTTTITASQAGDDSYNAAADVEKSLTVAKADQTITFGALPTNKKTGDADFAPGATASSGLDVTYASSNTAVATIVSGMIHIVAAGTTTITASQAGNDNYNAAADVTQALNVTATGILDASVKALGVSPNPADGYIKIDNAASLKKIEVLNMQGKVVKSVTNSGSQAVIDVSDLDAGIYTIRAKSGSDVYVSKFVKK